jgi:hypothetical protein
VSIAEEYKKMLESHDGRQNSHTLSRLTSFLTVSLKNFLQFDIALGCKSIEKASPLIVSGSSQALWRFPLKSTRLRAL